MSGSVAFQNQREFRCDHCSGKILVPKDLPPMTGPCPHCGTTITSPGPEEDKPPVQQVSAKVEVPAVVVKEKVEVSIAAPPSEAVRPSAGPPPLPPSARAPEAAGVHSAPVLPPEPAPAPAAKVPEPVAKAPEPAPAGKISEPEPVPASVPAAKVPEPVAKAPKPVPAARTSEPEPVPAPVPPPAPVAEAPEPAPPVKAPESASASPPERVVVPIGLSPVVPPPREESLPVQPAVPVAKKAEPSPQRAVVPIGLNPGPPPPQEKENADFSPEVPETPAAPQRVVVPIGLQEAIPAAPAPAAAPATPAEVPQPVAPAPAAYQAPVQETPVNPPPARPAPVKISIGLTEDLLAPMPPAPEPAPPAAAPSVPPAAAPVPSGGSADPRSQVPHSPIPADYTAAPEILRDREKPKAKNANKPRKSILLPMVLLLLLVLGGGGAALWWVMNKMGKGDPATVAVNPAMQAKIRESQYSEIGWQEEARQVLSSFLAATTPAGKAAFSIRGSELLPQMNQFYGPGPIDDSDTPLSGFAIGKLLPEDHKRGIFRMVYDQPPQFEMREFFRPLAPIEVQFGLEEPGLLLSSLARASNFSSEAVKVEVFFKREHDGLKIDWETFVQTKYRTFRTFTELPDPGRSGIFRLFVMEDVPERGRASQGTKTYRMVDPAHPTDAVRVEVAVDSELGKSLSLLNWRGVPGAERETKTATLELEWTRDASPRLALKKFICWEFLGIGGQAVNAPTPGSGR